MISVMVRNYIADIMKIVVNLIQTMLKRDQN